MKHNLFTHPTEVTISITKTGYVIENLTEAQSICDIFEDLDYNIDEIKSNLKSKIQNSKLIGIDTKNHILKEVDILLNDNGYLKNEEYR